MVHKFYLLVSGPKVYLPEGTKVEEHSITQEDIDEWIEDGETEQDVIDYFIEEEIAAWEQRWCQAVQITEDQYHKLATASPEKL
jgi:hypothetical protein